MKKIAILIVIFVCVGTALSAQIKLSAGAGGLFDYSLNSGTMYSFSSGAGELSNQLRNLSFGGYAFFDANYAELDVSFAYGSLTYVRNFNGNKFNHDYGSGMQLGFSLLLKYPLEVSKFAFYPLAGLNYNIFLSSKTDRNEEREDVTSNMSQFGLLAGLGGDFHANDRIYFRLQGLFQLRFGGKKMDEYFKDKKNGDPSWQGMNQASKIRTTLGMGPVIKLGVGIKFY